MRDRAANGVPTVVMPGTEEQQASVLSVVILYYPTVANSFVIASKARAATWGAGMAA